MELKFVYTLDEACTQPVDAGIRKIILYVAQNFGNDIALKKLDEIELKNLESALSILNEYIDKSGTESMQSHIQEETREDDKTPSKDQDTQSKKDQSL